MVMTERPILLHACSSTRQVSMRRTSGMLPRGSNSPTASVSTASSSRMPTLRPTMPSRPLTTMRMTVRSVTLTQASGLLLRFPYLLESVSNGISSVTRALLSAAVPDSSQDVFRSCSSPICLPTPVWFSTRHSSMRRTLPTRVLRAV